MRDRDRANKNEIEIFVFSVTSNDFPHDVLLLIFSLKIGAAIRNRGRSCADISGLDTAHSFITLIHLDKIDRGPFWTIR